MGLGVIRGKLGYGSILKFWDEVCYGIIIGQLNRYSFLSLLKPFNFSYNVGASRNIKK